MVTAKQADKWSYAAALAVSAEDPSLEKPARTRLRVLGSLAGQLNKAVEPNAIRVTDIMADAGLAHGTFYRYFDGQDAALEELMSGFLLFLREHQAHARHGAPGSPERIQHSIATYCRVFRPNTGLMRRLMSMETAGGPARDRFHAFNREWYVRTAEAMSGHRQASGSHLTEGLRLLPIAYALGGMVDEFLAQIYIRRDPNLAFLADDVEAIANTLTQAWCFGAYGDLTARGSAPAAMPGLAHVGSERAE